jgi:hypothetical protein
MTDRELLELAAKAAKIGGGWDWPRGAKHPMFWRDGSGKAWQPLDDDGDALRLAVKLKIAVDAWGAGACAVVFLRGGLGQIAEPHYGDDPQRATRRAIVRAAAELGRNT